MTTATFPVLGTTYRSAGWYYGTSPVVARAASLWIPSCISKIIAQEVNVVNVDKYYWDI